MPSEGEVEEDDDDLEEDEEDEEEKVVREEDIKEDEEGSDEDEEKDDEEASEEGGGDQETFPPGTVVWARYDHLSPSRNCSPDAGQRAGMLARCRGCWTCLPGSTSCSATTLLDLLL